jgi:hypothetical protein
MSFCTGPLEPLPRVRIELNPLFFGRCRLRSVSRWTRHSAKYVIGSEQLETGVPTPRLRAP